MNSDVGLVLEGTYPFVSGGVSSWVHHLTSQLPHLTFSILHISPKRGFQCSIWAPGLGLVPVPWLSSDAPA